ncbi:MAG: alpha-L-fucosidase [Chloroflexota bacterium]|nr:alpha-L-fucosidase [Chloroflexota bacterium]
MDAETQTGATGPPFRYEANWESLRSYTVPGWYQDAKFGIFIHWGVYAVPAFGSEWYPRNMYQQGSREFEHHVATYGPQAQFGYKDFIPGLTAESYDPAAWARLFRESGARYVVPVAEHHDGFPMYDCSFSDWTAVKLGPQRDLIGELADAVRREGLVFGVSYHRAENWFFFDGGRRFPSDVQDDRYRGLYGPAQPKPADQHDPHAPGGPDEAFLREWLERAQEIVDRYQPQVFWFDWWIEHDAFQPVLPRFAAYYYNRGLEWGPDWDTSGVAINHKYEAFPEGTAVFDIERGQSTGLRPLFWQTDTAISKNSWGYVEHQDYKTASAIVGDLVDIVSKNGSLLLNIGPRPDGTIPEPEQEVLREIGRWLAVNGEATYGTRPWVTFGEGPTQVSEGAFTDTQRASFTSSDIRFTTKGNVLYAICLGWPEGSVLIRSLGADSPIRGDQIARVTLLGSSAPLSWEQEEQGLKIEVPDERPCDHAYTFKLELQDQL